MRIERDDEAVSWDAVTALFEVVGWGRRDADECKAAFQRSTYKAFAYDGQELVGFARTVDDGRFYATIVDVVVAPAYQKRGVGRALVEDLQERLRGFLFVTLTAAPEVQPFYERLGFRRQRTAMILPRSPGQARANCDEP